MDPADLDQLATLADRRAAGAHVASAELRRVGDDLVALAAGFTGLRHAADALDTMGEADRGLAALCRRLALAARRGADPEPPTQRATPPRREVDPDDWRSWTEDDFPDDDQGDDQDGDRERETPRPATRGRDERSDDWDAAPLVADIRLGADPSDTGRASG